MKIDELDLLEAVLKLPEEKLHTIMAHILEDNGYDNIVTTDSYIIAKGDIDICVVAHMDIIHPHPPVKVVLNTNKNKLWSPSGLGADDRAGVFLILLLLKDGLRPHLILTLGEEAGGVGASTLAQNIHEPPFPVKYSMTVIIRSLESILKVLVLKQSLVHILILPLSHPNGMWPQLTFLWDM